MQDEDQPTRFSMVTCSEKFTLVLSVQGKIWFTGDKTSVGLESMNKGNQFGQETNTFQYYFVPYFDPTKINNLTTSQIKFISSNFNSKISHSINENN